MAKSQAVSTDVTILGIPSFIWKWLDGTIPGLTQMLWGEPSGEIVALAKKIVQGAGSPGGEEITETERKYLWIAGASLYPSADLVADKLKGTPFDGLKSDEWLLREGQLAALQLMELSGVRKMTDNDFPPSWRIVNDQTPPAEG